MINDYRGVFMSTEGIPESIRMLRSQITHLTPPKKGEMIPILETVKHNLELLRGAIAEEPKVGKGCLLEAKILTEEVLKKVPQAKGTKEFVLKCFGMSKKDPYREGVIDSAKALRETIEKRMSDLEDTASEATETITDEASERPYSVRSDSSLEVEVSSKSKSYTFPLGGTSSVLKDATDKLKEVVRSRDLGRIENASKTLEEELYLALSGSFADPVSLSKVPSQESLAFALDAMDILQTYANSLNGNSSRENEELNMRVADMRNALSIIQGEAPQVTIFRSEKTEIGDQIALSLRYLEGLKELKEGRFGIETKENAKLKKMALGRLFCYLKKAESSRFPVDKKIREEILSLVSSPSSNSKNKGLKKAIRTLVLTMRTAADYVPILDNPKSSPSIKVETPLFTVSTPIPLPGKGYILSPNGTSTVLEDATITLEKAVQSKNLSEIQRASKILEEQLYLALSGSFTDPVSLSEVPSRASLDRALEAMDILEEYASYPQQNWELKMRVADMRGALSVIKAEKVEVMIVMTEEEEIGEEILRSLDYLGALKEIKQDRFGIETKENAELKKVALGRLFYYLRKAEAKGFKINLETRNDILSLVGSPSSRSKNAGIKKAIRSLLLPQASQRVASTAASPSPKKETSSVLEEATINLEESLAKGNGSKIIEAFTALRTKLYLAILDVCNNPRDPSKAPSQKSIEDTLQAIEKLSAYSSPSLTPRGNAAQLRNLVSVLQGEPINTNLSKDSAILLRGELASILKKLGESARDSEAEKLQFAALFVCLNKVETSPDFTVHKRIQEMILTLVSPASPLDANSGIKSSIRSLALKMTVI